MNWSPLRTLTGRLVLVTLIAVAVSYAVAFALYANERGAALRRAAESAVVERVSYTAERLREAPPEMRSALADQVRDFSIHYSVASSPMVERNAAAGPAARVARGVAERMPGAQVRANARTVVGHARRWRAPERRDGPGDPRGRGDPRARSIELSVSAELAPNTWLNAVARLPGPRPAPLSVIVGGLISLLAVGIGAALIARQIGRPLADLADAAQALGAGKANVSAPVSGPDDVRRASTAFNAMAARLGRQLNRQRQMLWALSHDLRTPITALRLRAELIEDESLRQRLLAPIEEMERMTEQALSLARAGASEEERADVDLAEIARTLCGELEDMGLPISANAPSAVMVNIRPSEVARALRNLAENAAKYGGGGVMRVYRNESGEAVAEITDEGPGVPADVLPRLTEPFFRADAARSEANGAGLGLAIVQAIADGHGGRLVLENRTPSGLSAKFILPA